MTIKQVEQALADKIMHNEDFILKFVDIGQGSGKLGKGVLQAEKADKIREIKSMVIPCDYISPV